jgi:hypothetical protein
MALTVGRASEDRAQERDMVAARDPFHIFHVQLTAAHPIEHPIIVVARHKFLLLVSGPSSNLGKQSLHWLSFWCAGTIYRVRTEALVSTPNHAKPAWLGDPGACDPRFRSLHLLGFKKKRF